MQKVINTVLMLLMFQLGVINVFGQPKISVESTVVKLNQLLEGTDEISIQGKFLIVKGYSKGVQSKEDKVNKYDLDPTRVKFFEGENVVSVRCFSDLDGCIERKSLLVRKRAYRNRIAFSVLDREHGSKVAKAFNHLVSCFADKKYVGPDSLD